MTNVTNVSIDLSRHTFYESESETAPLDDVLAHLGVLAEELEEVLALARAHELERRQRLHKFTTVYSIIITFFIIFIN